MRRLKTHAERVECESFVTLPSTTPQNYKLDESSPDRNTATMIPCQQKKISKNPFNNLATRSGPRSTMGGNDAGFLSLTPPSAGPSTQSAVLFFFIYSSLLYLPFLPILFFISLFSIFLLFSAVSFLSPPCDPTLLRSLFRGPAVSAFGRRCLGQPSHPEAPVSLRSANPPKSLRKVAESDSGSSQIEHGTD